MSSAGDLLGTEQRLTNASGSSSTPRIATDGDGFAVVWVDERAGYFEFYFQRLAATGAPVGNAMSLGTDDPALPGDIVWDGSSWVVVWPDKLTTGGYVYEMQRVGADGVPVGMPVQVATDPELLVPGRLARVGTVFGVSWYRQIPNPYELEYHTTLMDGSLTLITDHVVSYQMSPSFVGSMAITSSGSSFVTVLADATQSPAVVRDEETGVTGTAVCTNPNIFSLTTYPQGGPLALVRESSDYAVVISEYDLNNNGALLFSTLGVSCGAGAAPVEITPDLGYGAADAAGGPNGLAVIWNAGAAPQYQLMRRVIGQLHCN